MVATLVLVKAQFFNISSYNPALKTNLACNLYTDCYNCTLSNCDWQGNGLQAKCSDNANRLVKLLTWETFIEKSFICKDTRGLCA